MEKVGKSREGSYSSFGPRRPFKEFQGNSLISEFRRESNGSWMREPQINWHVGKYWKQIIQNVVVWICVWDKLTEAWRQNSLVTNISFFHWAWALLEEQI